MPFFLYIIVLFFLQFCTPSYENPNGINDPRFINVAIKPNTEYGIQIDLGFLPNIDNIPTGSQYKKYIISFTINQPNFGDPNYYEKTTAFLSFTNIGSLQDALYQIEGIVYKNCESPCSSIITQITNTDNEILTQEINGYKPTISKSSDGFFHILVYVHPLHTKEAWQSIHGFPTNNIGLPQIAYPFYKVDFQLIDE